MIDVVSETYRVNWEEACRLNVIEFLNVYGYYVAKNNYEIALKKAEYEKIKAKHKIH